MPPEVPSLETPRLRLRPIEMSDADRIQEIFPDWEVVKWLAAAIPWPYPEDGAAAWLQTVVPQNGTSERFTWAITEKNDPLGRLIGVVELFPSNLEDNRGFWLGRDYHRRGYMTEAVVAVTDYAFDVLRLPYLLLGNAEQNIGSHRLKEISGAKISEIRDDVAFVSGLDRAVRWKLLPDDWKANRDRILARSEG